MRHLIWICALALTACGPGSHSGAIQGSRDSPVDRLEPGMTPGRVGRITGAESGSERSPANSDETCVSYVYDETLAPKYVHAVFNGGTLVRASDGHTGLCSYDAMQPAI